MCTDPLAITDTQTSYKWNQVSLILSNFSKDEVFSFLFSLNKSQLQKIKINEKLIPVSINEIFSRETQIFTQSNGQKSLFGLMSSNNRDVLKWCMNYFKIMPPHQRIFHWLMRKIPIRRKSFSQCSCPSIPPLLHLGVCSSTHIWC